MLGGRETRRDRGACDEQVRRVDEPASHLLRHAEGELDPSLAKRPHGIDQGLLIPPVVNGDDRAGVGQEARGGGAGAGQAQDDGDPAVQIGARSYGAVGGHHRSS